MSRNRQTFLFRTPLGLVLLPTASFSHSRHPFASIQVLDNALFAHAESVSSRFFGKDVYYRGIVEFSNVSGQGWR